MNNWQQFEDELQSQGIDFRKDEPLKKHTTFHIGGPAAYFCLPADGTQAAAVLGICREMSVPYFVLGNGSNTLFCDAGFSGAVVSMGNLNQGMSVKETIITVQAGVLLADCCRAARDADLSGLEFAYGIPGSLGGAVYMNAGAYGGEMKQVLRAVTFLDECGAVRTLPVEELQLDYRTSIFKRRDWCILSAELALCPGDKETIRDRMDELMERRRTKQPLDYPSAGSTFKRPEGAFAGALIEQCGLKGLRVGGAAVSEKHCGFVVNLGGATCHDVQVLTQQVQQIVKEKTGYMLECEIQIIEG